MPKGHFGDAPWFDLYRITAREATAIQRVENTVRGEDEPDHHHHHHGDSHGGGTVKAHRIGDLLGARGVQVLVSRAFGPNIQIVSAHFVPVVVRCETVAQAIALLHQEWVRVLAEWSRGAERRHLVLR
jgi:predicted Fe-Mo cluster-binding NifX family protein